MDLLRGFQLWQIVWWRGTEGSRIWHDTLSNYTLLETRSTPKRSEPYVNHTSSPWKTLSFGSYGGVVEMFLFYIGGPILCLLNISGMQPSGLAAWHHRINPRHGLIHNTSPRLNNLCSSIEDTVQRQSYITEGNLSWNVVKGLTRAVLFFKVSCSFELRTQPRQFSGDYFVIRVHQRGL